MLRPLPLVILAVVLVGATVGIAAGPNQPNISFQAPALSEVHFGAGETVELDHLDATRLYVAEAGSRLTVRRAGSSASVRFIARDGARLEASGNGINVSADPGSHVTVGDGVRLDATGAQVTVRGNATVKAFAGTIVHNLGTGDEYAYAGSLSYSRSRGRTFAYEGAVVYALSPDECDACTQVAVYPGSIAYVFEGAEAFGRGAEVHVFRGGEVGCYGNCRLYLHAGAESNYDAESCQVENIADEDDPPAPPSELVVDDDIEAP